MRVYTVCRAGLRRTADGSYDRTMIIENVREVDMKASVLFDEAISLPVEERAHLVDCLLQTFNPPDEAHAAALAAVARRRLNELRAGRVGPIAGEEGVA